MHLTISVGVAHTRVTGHDPDHLYAAADAALYRAKRGGRDQVAVGAVRVLDDPDLLDAVES